MANNKDFKVKNGIQPTAYHEAVGTVTSAVSKYLLTELSFSNTNQSFDYSGTESRATGIFFKPDGTRFYTMGYQSGTSDGLRYYDLSTAWDLSTASSVGGFNTATQSTTPWGLFIGKNGTRVYTWSNGGDTSLRFSLLQYNMSSWGGSTGTYAGNYSFSDDGVSVGNGRGVWFKDDGTQAYILDSASTLYVINLTTAWDLSTASHTSGDNVAMSSVLNDPEGIAFSDDGTLLFVSETNSYNYRVQSFPLSTAWDVSTLDLNSSEQAFVDADLVSDMPSFGQPSGLQFRDGQELFVGYEDGVVGFNVSQTTATLDLSTGSVFEITPTSDIQIGLSNPAASGTVSAATLLLDGAGGFNLSDASYDSVSFSFASQDTIPVGLVFKTDGTAAYMTGTNLDLVYQYTLSTAWDLSTISYASKSWDIGVEATAPTDVAFKSDGTKMYALNTTGYVYQYTLSTAWDVSTASYDSVSFNASAQGSSTWSIRFKPDGTKFYLNRQGKTLIYQYSMSTAWDLSTASYDSVSFDASEGTTDNRSFDFNTDGTGMMVVSATNDTVYQYTLSTAWDLSTATYASKSFDVSSQSTLPNAVFVGDNGQKMFVLDGSVDTGYQYSIGSEVTITYDTTLEFAGGTAPTSPAIGETDVLTFSTRDGGTSYQAALAIDGAK